MTTQSRILLSPQIIHGVLSFIKKVICFGSASSSYRVVILNSNVYIIAIRGLENGGFKQIVRGNVLPEGSDNQNLSPEFINAY